MNYAAAASRGVPPQISHESQRGTRGASGHATPNGGGAEEPRRRSTSPSHIPRTSSPEANVYVLTLMTDGAHHGRMTQLRNDHFPKRLNRLAAHLTLFHALPGSRLDSHILPHIESVASKTRPFQVHASKPFRMKKGIAISVPRDQGGSEGSRVHQQLQKPWLEAGFLSDQDSGGCRLHYTIMNKVDDDVEVDKAFQEVSQHYRGDVGTVQGLMLWRYDRGTWRKERKFEFQGAEHQKPANDHSQT